MRVTEMAATGIAAFDTFIAETRALYDQGLEGETLWRGIAKRLEALVSDEDFKRLSDDWPIGDGKQYVLYEDPDHGFVIDGLVRGPYHKAIRHDHAHTWTAYGIVTGWERLTRYDRTDDGSDPKHADLEQVSADICQAGTVDVIAPWDINTESNDDNRAVALSVRSETLGHFDQTVFRDDGTVGAIRGLKRIDFPLR
jgi:predicted metal-dependent enzyme (double-stranded beta helix superfamily)